MSSQDEAKGITEATLARLCSSPLSILLILWLPLVVLVQIDAMLAYLRGWEVVSDAALFVVLISAGSAVLGLVAWAAKLIATRVGSAHANLIAWSIALLPPLLLVAMQVLFSVRYWLQVVLGTRVTVEGSLRVFIAVALLAFATALVSVVGIRSLIGLTLNSISKWNPVAAALICASIFWVIFFAPRVSWPFGRIWHASSAERSFDHQPPDIILITMDALAAKDVNPCGSGPTFMPNLRKFASVSICFSNYYASSNFTTPTTSTIETGALPWTHWAAQLGSNVVYPMQAATIGNVLRADGYDTFVVSANENASPLHHGTFQNYSDVEVVPSRSLRTNFYEWLMVFPNSSLTSFLNSMLAFFGTIDIYASGSRNPYDAEAVYSRGLDLLSHQSRRRPTFLWLHTLAPHSPYLPPISTFGKLLPAGNLDNWRDYLPENYQYTPDQQQVVDQHHRRYDECIMGADLALGHLLEALKKGGWFQHSVVIISADHGDSFEKGYLGHAGPLLHNALIKVPLLIKPAEASPGLIVETATSQADLAPTITMLAGAPTLRYAEGRSLVPALSGHALADIPVFSMSLERQSRFQRIGAGHFAMVEGRYKFIYDLASRRFELFDLAIDPSESHNIARERAALANRMQEALLSQIARAEKQRELLVVN